MNISRIAEERKRLGLSQKELADRLKISQKSISKYECGDRRPSFETLIAMSSLFGVSIDYLLGNDIPAVSLSSSQTSICACDSSIKYWINNTGLGYDEVSQKLGISENVLLDYINDRIAMPYTVLISLAELCEVSTDCLLGISNKNRQRDLDNILPFKYNYSIADRIKKLCNESLETTSSFLENLLSLTSKEVFYLVEYGFVPHVDTILKLAEFFNVSTDYLLCKSDLREEKMLSTFKMLNDDNKDIILGDAKKALRDQKYEESVAADKTLKKTGTDCLGK